MFQISDDLLDIESDIKNNKPNICIILDTTIITTLLKDGCEWLYINAKHIYKMMESIELEKDSNSKTNNIKKAKLSFDIKAINEIIEKIENRKK
jgi:hypothetical protein